MADKPDTTNPPTLEIRYNNGGLARRARESTTLAYGDAVGGEPSIASIPDIPYTKSSVLPKLLDWV